MTSQRKESKRDRMDRSARDPRHNAAYRAVLDYCSGGVQGIGPFEAAELVRLVERAYSDHPLGAVEVTDDMIERGARALDAAAAGGLDERRNEHGLEDWAAAVLHAALEAPDA